MYYMKLVVKNSTGSMTEKQYMGGGGKKMPTHKYFDLSFYENTFKPSVCFMLTACRLKSACFYALKQWQTALANGWVKRAWKWDLASYKNWIPHLSLFQYQKAAWHKRQGFYLYLDKLCSLPSCTVTPQLSHWIISSASSLLSPRQTQQMRICWVLQVWERSSKASWGIRKESHSKATYLMSPFSDLTTDPITGS